ncbi:hypothetical protein PN441_05910 [Spirulina major CS-329]|jgi:hypothetical protein|uniref:hypothetical protein n=1 Tax=Spirulina TaxID=1154 RepID=UPI00093218DD|nr:MULTISPECIES: hypothetical protein [Spirulina]MDB9496311.1 hypothetical protein [Spirulina subsalsa CS-330]MDB9502602.1 hypothetical protein [Spirulina major CS-329]
MATPQSEAIASTLFFTVLGITVVTYLLRGLSLFSFLPGGILWILLLLSIGTGVFYGIEKTRRF